MRDIQLSEFHKNRSYHRVIIMLYVCGMCVLDILLVPSPPIHNLYAFMQLKHNIDYELDTRV